MNCSDSTRPLPLAPVANDGPIIPFLPSPHLLAWLIALHCILSELGLYCAFSTGLRRVMGGQMAPRQKAGYVQSYIHTYVMPHRWTQYRTFSCATMRCVGPRSGPSWPRASASALSVRQCVRVRVRAFVSASSVYFCHCLCVRDSLLVVSCLRYTEQRVTFTSPGRPQTSAVRS